MEFEKGICPKCLGVLQIPLEREEVICMYCGEKIRTKEAADLAEAENTVRASRDLEMKESPAKEHPEEIPDMSESIIQLFDSVKSGFENFKRNTYKDAFEAYFRSNYEIYTMLEKTYEYDDRNKTVFYSLADTFVNVIHNRIKDFNKRKKERILIDYNLTMAVYVIPGILHYGGEFTDVFTGLLIQSWKKEFPSYELGKATFETINSGFKTKLCYITTAVCESLGKTDDCYELNVLRNYRDCYLAKQPDGLDIIYQYYDIAPTIVNRVNKSPDRNKIYHDIWDEYVKPCITLIEEDKNEECKKVYSKMVHQLQKRFVEDKNEYVSNGN